MLSFLEEKEGNKGGWVERALKGKGTLRVGFNVRGFGDPEEQNLLGSV